MSAPRVLIALGPGMYAEGLAFSLRKHRPHAEVTILGPSEGVGAAALQVRPHLVVAHRVPPGARGAFFWVEVAQLVGGKPVGAEISADGYSRSVADVGTGDVLAALGPRQARAGGQDT
jgi:hypothetical protein